MIDGFYVRKIYLNHALELAKRYRRVTSRSYVIGPALARPTTNYTIDPSSHKSVATVRLAAAISLDITV